MSAERSFPAPARPTGMMQQLLSHLLRAFWHGLVDFFDSWAALSPDYVTFWGPNPDAWLAHLEAPDRRR